MANKQFRALSTYGDGILRVLEVAVGVAAPVGGPGQDQVNARQCKGIWDTGATGVVITQSVVDDLGLQPVGMAQTHTANGTATVPVYLISIALPNGLLMDVAATCQNVVSCDVLIGMEVINQGDFSVTNVGGKTTLTFRVPSCQTIDYVKDAQSQNKHAAPTAYKPHRSPKGKRPH